jgi:hypothetical protein
MGNCLTGDASRLIVFHGFRAADFSGFSVSIAPLFGEARHAR